MITTAAQARDQFFESNVRDLNRLVFAAEALEVPDLPDVPYWGKSPRSFELDEELTLEEARELGLAWQVLAGQLHDLLEGLDLEAFGEEVAGLHAKAKAAREALIRLDSYEILPAEGG